MHIFFIGLLASLGAVLSQVKVDVVLYGEVGVLF
jgi:hypothetical protein